MAAGGYPAWRGSVQIRSAHGGQERPRALLDPVEASGLEVAGVEEGVGEADGVAASVEPGAGVGRIHAVGGDDLQEGQGTEAGADVRGPDPGRWEELLQRRPGAMGS